MNMKRVICLLLVLAASLAYAADPFLLHDLRLGATLIQARTLIPTLAPAEAAAPLQAWRAAGPIGEVRDIRLLFRDGKLVSISFATAAKTFAHVRKALGDLIGPWSPAEDGHWAYEARRGTQRLQVLKRDDDSAWVVWLDMAAFGGTNMTPDGAAP